MFFSLRRGQKQHRTMYNIKKNQTEKWLNEKHVYNDKNIVTCRSVPFVIELV